MGKERVEEIEAKEIVESNQENAKKDIKKDQRKVYGLIKKTYKGIIVFICLVLFVAILEDVLEEEMLNIDKLVYTFVVLNFRTEILTKVMYVITQFGAPIILITTTIAILILYKNKKTGILIIANLVISTLLNYLLKNIIQRPRPKGYRLIEESGYSFPSGHSMVSMAFYGFLIYLIWNNMKNKTAKYILCSVLTVLMLSIGFSRIYLGVHYASDVIAGFLVSIAYLIIFISSTK